MTSAQRNARTERGKAKTPSDAPAQLIALARILARQAVREAIALRKIPLGTGTGDFGQ
ncbi:hypothetical protein L3V16_18920 [Brucella ciceri]|uniref:hypothetical protein n=1 Tax=Brucella ciceri TaxID=391287 RepID=UPI001F13B394|nr:hypothetical protein [Brucella ciceri]MCH6205898.1 hypothetical protein [Brucella ciceri]